MKIGIYGYGNLGRGVEAALRQNPDMEIVGVFTRRDPAAVKTVTGIPVYSAALVGDFSTEIDVMISCGGSATDLPEMTPMLAGQFNVVDSFDTHARVPEHFAKVEKAAMTTAHTALISAGWDPGLFSLARLYMNTVLPEGKDYVLGPGRQPGTQRRDPPDPRRKGRAPVYRSRAGGAGKRTQRGKPGSFHPAEAHPGMLCGGGGRRGQGPD